MSRRQPADLPCGALGDLEASSGVIFNVGLTGRVNWLERTNDRLLAADEAGNWALWDLSDKTILANGENGEDPDRTYCSDGCPFPDLSSDRFTIVSSTQIQMRSLLDGSLIASSATPDSCDDPEDACAVVNQGGLASDGSYYWSGTAEGIKAWDESGTLLLTKSGNYTKRVRVSAAPDELRIALGEAGAGVIERISIDTGASTTSSFAGTFHSWFLDGGRFLTTLNTTVRVYAADTATQEAIAALPQVSRLTGQGDYFWSLGWDGQASTMAIFAVADPSTPAAVYADATAQYPAAGHIGLIRATEVTVVELDPSGVTDSTVDLPPAPRIGNFTSDAAGNWAVGNHWGVVYDGGDLERPLSCGQVTDIAGSEHGTVAIATFVGILLFEFTPDSRTYLGSLPFPSWDLDLSNDGSVLAAASLHTVTDMGDAALKIFSLPDRSELRSSSYPPSVENVSVSELGNRFSYTTAASQTVTDLAGNVSFTRSGGEVTRLALSPDGSRVAAPSGTPNDAATTTDIYENGTLIDALSGYAMLWLDQDHLLVNTVGDFNDPNKPGGARIYTVSGGFQPGPRLPSLGYADPRMISSNEVYAEPRSNSVYSLSTGELLWSCDAAPEGQGTVAAGNIVFSKGNKVVITPY